MTPPCAPAPAPAPALTPALAEALAEAGEDWRAHMRLAARGPGDLARYGALTPAEADALAAVSARYETLVAPYYLSLLAPRGAPCPIRPQAIPQGEELLHLPEERPDPIGDKEHSPTPILVHRYRDRALLFPTYRCPMFCRYCFRKDTLNAEAVQLHRDLPPALSYLRAHPEIEEVILSGGDPLMLSDERLGGLLGALKGAGVRRLRLHSRFVVTLPYRVTEALADALRPHAPLTLVAHFNHAREVTPPARAAAARLAAAGVRVLNQSVLLRGVNDDVGALRDLSRALVEAGVQPYYLHHPDLTAGTQHLRVSLTRGLALTRALRGTLSGHALPLYVLDIPGGGGKVAVDSAAVRQVDGARWALRSPLTGREEPYVDLAYDLD